MFSELFASNHIMGTLVIVAGIILMVMRSQPNGRKWMVNKFGENWDKKIFSGFFGWPMALCGLVMYYDDGWLTDVIKLGFLFAVYVGFQFYKKRKQANDKVRSA